MDISQFILYLFALLQGTTRDVETVVTDFDGGGVAEITWCSLHTRTVAFPPVLAGGSCQACEVRECCELRPMYYGCSDFIVDGTCRKVDSIACVEP